MIGSITYKNESVGVLGGFYTVGLERGTDGTFSSGKYVSFPDKLDAFSFIDAGKVVNLLELAEVGATVVDNHSQESRAKVMAQKATVANVDIYLDNVGLPTYTELLAALKSMLKVQDSVDPEGLFRGIESTQARALVARADGH